MQFYTTPEFLQVINELCKRPKDGYSSCKEDICNEFKDKSLEELWDTEPFLINNSRLRLIKARFCNSGASIGQSGAFRILYIITKDIEEIIFIYVFPKRGKFGKQNISLDESKEYFKNAIEAKKNNTLIKIDISNFKQIE
jgi:hypothetical protein